MTTPTPFRLLLIGHRYEGWAAVRSGFAECTKGHTYECTTASSVGEASRLLLGGEVSAVLIGLDPSDRAALRSVRQLAAFNIPLLVCADRLDTALEAQAFALGAGDWLVGEEAENPSVLCRALRCAIEQQRTREHSHRERRLLRQLQSAVGVEILMREAGHTIGNTLTPTQLLAFRGQEMVPEPGKSLFVEIEQTVGEASKSLARIHNLRRGLDTAWSAPSVVAIEDALRSSLKPLRRALPSTVELIVETEGASGEKVLLDEIEFPHIVLNLALNAIDAMRGSGNGVLRLKLDLVSTGDDGPRRNDFVELALSDNGTGIAQEYRDRIFDPFFTTKAEEGAVGLGLSACRVFMERLGGSIAVETEEGKGSCFRLRFPRAEDAIAECPQGDFSFGAGNLGVLLIDADERVLTFTGFCLGRIGVTVLTAPDGEVARQQFATHRDRIDMVLMDPALPDEHGLALWQYMKGLKPSLDLITISAEVDELVALGLPDRERRQALAKPFTLSRLTTVIEDLLAAKD